jgi:pseudaminic acid biosynthesis-associated methylase
MNYSTEQEAFWAGAFGDQYIGRNSDERSTAANISLFSEALRHVSPVASVLELGCNIGLNLSAIHALFPRARLTGLEINHLAAATARTHLPQADIHVGSLLEPALAGAWELVITKGVLMHIAPDSLPEAYAVVHRHASKWILLCEYYNPVPVGIDYRGHSHRLFKRDFAGEMLDRFADLRIRDYGFRYRRDPVAPADDLT